jgi:hypothetical protein
MAKAKRIEAHNISENALFRLFAGTNFFLLPSTPRPVVVVLFVSNFIERFISGIYVCRTLDENIHIHFTRLESAGAGGRDEKKCLS